MWLIGNQEFHNENIMVKTGMFSQTPINYFATQSGITSPLFTVTAFETKYSVCEIVLKQLSLL